MGKKNILISSIAFVAGVGIGSFVTWKVAMNICEDRIEEEVAHVKEKYSTPSECVENNEGCDNIDINDGGIESTRELDSYDEIIKTNNYDCGEEERSDDMYTPEVVPPGETWEYEYPTITLTYFEEDNVLVTDKNKIIKNYAELVGNDFTQHFGEYSQDTVVVRNDKTKAYYEILRDYGSFEDYNSGKYRY